MIKIIVNGSLGKMGKVLTNSIFEDANFELIAGVSKYETENTNYKLYSNILDVKEKADVVIDFSNPESLKDLLTYSKKTKTPLVIATTGYNDDELDMIKEASKEVPIFHSSNMSLGVNLLLKLVEVSAKALTNFDIEIVEKHHNRKVDAPSGTALMLANEIQKVLNNTEFNYGRYGKDAKRKEKEIGIHAVRGGTIVGDHSVIFAGKDEIVELNHIALSKEIFAQGSLKAAKFIVNKENGYYNMKDVVTL
ncbi:4-hydroxy-tetrahydrodipicolinate reductase [Tepidibacter formicigenes]|jgi:4-hydroxy-tetrahydrodipicolinate reductase|uniref:4-hydroxy-tetrahydrodipicolinate reductase n=1 Tax=Tepidibacter formicigenes DSM 15518 TaxID=1123349 RepID=A0A1M6MLL5_9FIRM|nr:4-hydroxy-tetrahydrodipicolinate reductase [Tepidibacter formicigenes]SHJ84357.1 dihydrodipicolinate reductase [Tepidibacter formicigenes DSM 15518]